MLRAYTDGNTASRKHGGDGDTLAWGATGG